MVMRFRRRNDAESYLKVIQQMRPKAQFTVSFETNAMQKAAEAAKAEASLSS
jgi:hypothetical protein